MSAMEHDGAGLRALWVALGREVLRSSGATDAQPDAANRERAVVARDALHEVQRAHGVQLLGDQDPHVAPGFFVARGLVPGLAQLPRLTRSWESFDRLFERCTVDEEQRLVRERALPFLRAAGLWSVGLAVAQTHLWVVDGRYVGAFPDERLAPHLADAGAPASDPETTAILAGLERALELGPG